MVNRLVRGGLISVKLNGEIQDGVGNFDYVLSGDERTTEVGATTVLGASSKPVVPYIEGEISDRGDLDLVKLFDAIDVTVTLALKNGKTILGRNGWYTGPRQGSTEKGIVKVRWDFLSCEEVPA